jgi:hypothetical protein
MGIWIGLASIFGVPSYLGYNGYNWGWILSWVMVIPLLHWIYDSNRAITNFNLYRKAGFASFGSFKLFFLLRIASAIQLIPIYLLAFYISRIYT